MTLIAERPAPPARVATTALARAEARRLWHDPLVWIGIVLAIALCLVWSWTRMQTWETFHENTGMGSMVLAAALLLATHMAASRDQRAGAEESTRTMPAGPGRRSIALLVAVPAAAAIGALVYVVDLVLLLPSWPAGAFDPWTALVPAVVPAIGAAVGIAVGRALPHPAAGALTIVGFVGILFALLMANQSQGDWGNVLFPVPLFGWGDYGVDYAFEWHLLYLLGLLALAVAAVCREAVPKASAVIAVVAVVVSGFAVQREEAAAPDLSDAGASQPFTTPDMLVCQTHERVRYCALPGYEHWIEEWRQAVEPVSRLLPADAERPAIRQISRSDDHRPLTPGHPELVVGDTWGRLGRWAEDSRTRLMRDYVATSVGILRRDDLMSWRSCDAGGQHRTVVALWLLGQVAPAEPLTVPRVRYGSAEADAAASLLAKPQDEVSAHLAGRWSEVLDPSATALAGLGVTLTPPPIPAEEPEETSFEADRGVCR